MPPVNSDDVWVALWFNYEFLDDVKEEALAVFYQKISTKGTGFEWYNHKNMQKERDTLNPKRKKLLSSLLTKFCKRFQ